MLEKVADASILSSSCIYLQTRSHINTITKLRILNMPRISMWKEGAHSNDFKFFDRTIKEQFTVGGTGIHVHKYLGIMNQGPSADLSQPQATEDDPHKTMKIVIHKHMQEMPSFVTQNVNYGLLPFHCNYDHIMHFQ